MYLKNSETDYEALKVRRIIRKASKEENERAFVFKKPVFRPLRKLEKQDTVSKGY